MIKEFVPYDLAIQLKELGFDEPCFGWYDAESPMNINYDCTNNSCGWLTGLHCSAPTYSQAFRWFRDNYKMTAEVSVSQYRRTDIDKWMYSITYLERMTYSYSETTYNTYEEAELACLKKLIEIVKNK